MSAHHQKKIQICRVYAPPEKKDGVWILIDRLWPRGLKKEQLDFDLWFKDITPSTTLRKWFHQDPKKRWHEFVERYIEELNSKSACIEQIKKSAQNGPVTLFYASKDTEHNHAIVLEAVIRSWPKSPNLESIL